MGINSVLYLFFVVANLLKQKRIHPEGRILNKLCVLRFLEGATHAGSLSRVNMQVRRAACEGLRH